MNRKNTFQYILALLVCFLLGMALALVMRSLDMRKIKPLEGGQHLPYSDFGFSMRIPNTAIVRDHTLDNLESGGDALYAGSITTQEDGVLYLFCYENVSADSIDLYPKQDVVSHYMSAGATQVRFRDLGGRQFICYRASVLGPDGEQLWDTYETWDENIHLVFETRMNPWDVLPILQTVSFMQSAPAD